LYTHPWHYNISFERVHPVDRSAFAMLPSHCTYYWSLSQLGESIDDTSQPCPALPFCCRRIAAAFHKATTRSFLSMLAAA